MDLKGAAGAGALPSSPSLRRVLTAPQLVMFGIGAVLGAGIFVLTGTAAAQFAGPAVVVSFVIAGVVCTFAGLCYAELATLIPAPGGAYSYTYAALGEAPAWFIGWAITLEYLFGGATVAVGWGGYFVGLVRSIGDAVGLTWSLPRLLSSAPINISAGGSALLTGSIINLPAVAIVVVLAAICYRGISTSSRLNSVLVIVKILVILIFLVVALEFIDPAHWHPFVPHSASDGQYGWHGIVRGAALVFFAYIGFDSVSTMAAEVKNPQRDLPIGILGSLIICTILYILVAGAVTGLAPYISLNTASPITTALHYVYVSHGRNAYGIAALVLNGSQIIVSFGALFGLSTVIIATIIAVPRILYMMSIDGLLPRFLSAVHSKYRIPYFGTIITAIVVSALAGLFPIEVLGDVVSMGTLVAFATVCVSVLVLRYKKPSLHRTFRVPLALVVCPVGAGSCLWLLWQIVKVRWELFLGWGVSAVLIYGIYGYRHARSRWHESEVSCR